MDVPEEKLRQLYTTMVRIRQFEEKAFDLFATAAAIPGPLHLYAGQEAVASGVCANLRKDDYITSTHRGHGHCIAKGARLDRMLAELMGKETGYCRGKGGSMHVADLTLNNLGATAIVGAMIPVAVGAGLSARMRGTDQVVACFFGEGASNNGIFHEGLNLAAAWSLPVVFVCENNLYAMGTRISRVMLLEDISKRASSYGMPGVTVDGMDAIAVYKAAGQAVERARKGNGPTLVECKTYRWRGHSRADPALYRPKDEVEAWRKRDPIKIFREGKYLPEDELNRIDTDVQSEIEAAVKFATESPYPDVQEALQDVFA